jgi:magnesium and cobalt transporter
VGEIDDEHDPEESGSIEPDVDIDGRPCFAVKSLTRIEDFNDFFGAELTLEEDYDTIGGLVLQRLGRLPRLGEKLEYGGFEFRVTKADRRRIDMLQVTRVATDAAIAG